MKLIKRYTTLSYIVFLTIVSLIVNLYFYLEMGGVGEIAVLGGPMISTYLFIRYGISLLSASCFLIGSGVGWLAWYFSIKYSNPYAYIFSIFAVIVWIVIGYILVGSSFYA